MTSKTFIIHPWFKNKANASSDARTPESCLEEAVGLAHAIDLEVVEKICVALAAPKPATLFGSGKVEEIGGYIEHLGAQLVVINTHVSPVQQRNLEKAWNCKVIDRTALILEIFGARARTQRGNCKLSLLPSITKNLGLCVHGRIWSGKGVDLAFLAGQGNHKLRLIDG